MRKLMVLACAVSMLVVTGCRVPLPEPIEKPSVTYYSTDALDCPLCGGKASVCKWFKDPDYYHFVWPDDATDKGWLFQCECRAPMCPVNPDFPAYMRERDAINEWNTIASRKYR